MAKRRGRKPVKQKESNVDNADTEEALPDKVSSIYSADKEKAVLEKHKTQFQVEEDEHKIAAIRALRDAEIEQLQTILHLLRSYFSKDQLQVPVLQFFKQIFPKLSIVENDTNGQYELQQEDDVGNLYINQGDGVNLRPSLLHQLSTVYPDFSTAKPSIGVCEFSNRSAKTSFFGVDTLQISGFDLEELSDAQIFERPDKFQTPDVSTQRLSIGVTPKTKRLPKHGEMLVSVHGSPLGVYKEDNMEAIHEMEDD